MDGDENLCIVEGGEEFNFFGELYPDGFWIKLIKFRGRNKLRRPKNQKKKILETKNILENPYEKISGAQNS